MKTVFGDPTKPDWRFAMFGMRGSGKTVSLTCLHHACIDYANRHPTEFYFRVEEKSSGIRQARSDLQSGHFPPPTPPNTLFEADFIIKRKRNTGTRTIVLPFIETAGEEISKLITRFGQGMYAMDQNDFLNANSIQENILNVDGIGLIVPVDRAQTLGDKGLDAEPENVSNNPDVNLSRLVDAIYNYKERMGLPAPRAIGVFLTKSDKLMQPLSVTAGINLNTPEGIRTFMTTYFSETYSLLNFRTEGMRNVRFWPVWVQLALEKKTLQPLKYDDGTEIIMTDRKHHTAVFSRPAYEQFIEWLFQIMG